MTEAADGSGRHTVWLSLGSNQGAREEMLRQGMNYLHNHGLPLAAWSGIYETKPVGYIAQEDFYNIVVRCDTTLAPMEVLRVCQDAEAASGRRRLFRWGPRTLDVDILLYDRVAMDTQALTLPHPRMGERAFVLGPLGELDMSVLEEFGWPCIQEGIHLIIPKEDVTMLLEKTS